MDLKIFWLFFSLLISCIANTQETEREQEKQEEKFFRPDGVFVGVDVSKFLLKALQPERTEYEFSLDFGLNENFFIVGEGGFTNYNYTGEDFLYDYFSEGNYWRAGFCYNLHKNIERSDIVSVGLLFGHASFEHTAQNVSIIDKRYGQLNIDNLTYPGQQANWLEPYFSIKVELFANIYLGWSLRARAYLGGSDFIDLRPNILPGYGNFNSNTNACITYNIFYRIPF